MTLYNLIQNSILTIFIAKTIHSFIIYLSQFADCILSFHQLLMILSDFIIYGSLLCSCNSLLLIMNILIPFSMEDFYTLNIISSNHQIMINQVLIHMFSFFIILI